MKGWTSIKDKRDNECCENQPRFAIMSEDDEERRLKSDEERRKCDKRKRKEKRKREKDDLKSFTKLMGLSAAGKTKKLRKMLEKDAYLDLYTIDPEGHTALHKAASYGHADTAELLLKHGADAKAEDFLGNTPLHLAAKKQHLSTLTVLLKAQELPGLDALNSDGVSIRQLMQFAMEEHVAAARAKGLSAQRSASPAGSHDSEEAWRQKLHDNANYDDFEAAAAGYESFEDVSAPGSYGEDEEMYARRMWEAMNRKKYQAGPAPTATAADAWASADAAQSKRQKAAEEAAHNSRRILEEEQARDQAWRQAVLQGDLGARRAHYEAKWHVFALSKDTVSFDDVPWLVKDRDDARAVILYGTSDSAEERKRVRLELMRWHPDKFSAKFGGRLASRDKNRILERVKHISQMLNTLSSGSTT